VSESFSAGGSRKNVWWAIAVALLIDAPFVSILYFLGGKPEPLMLIAAFLPLAISVLIIYSSYAGGKMEYLLGDDELRIGFPLSPLRVSYGKIKGAGKVDTSLGFRLFGGSLPGVHWGMFTTSNLGNVQAYATRYKGTFVLLELSDGSKVLIAPLEPDVFLEALRKKTTFAAPTLPETGEPRLDRRFAAVQISIVTIAWLALIAYVAYIYPGLPEVIPVHFGFNGVPNRYGSKVELLILAAFSTIFPALNAVFALKFSKYNKGLNAFLGVVFLLALCLFAFAVNQMISAI
jgi:hypothetical protein